MFVLIFLLQRYGNEHGQNNPDKHYTTPQNNNLHAYKHNRGISVNNGGIYLLGR